MALKYCSPDHLPQSTPDRELLSEGLQNANDLQRTRIVLLRPKDPVAVLPLEVLELMFSHLEYRQHIHMLRVSTAWNEVIHNLPLLLNTLNFRGATTKIKPKMLDAALQRWKMPKVAKLANLTDPSMDRLMQELQSWRKFKSLECFDVQGSLFMPWTLPLHKYNLREIVIDALSVVPLDWICNTLLRQCLNLQIARFLNVRKGPSPSGLRLSSDCLLELTLRCNAQDAAPVSCPLSASPTPC